MKTCQGKARLGIVTCGNKLFMCTKCGVVGCDQSEYDECTGQAFMCGQCLKCGNKPDKSFFTQGINY